ncbi:MAG: protein kinase [Acidobacteriota bacterium]|nr:protein kinase [Acidobacteriota bacterium]
MSISPGSRLGPYEILAPIGAGGMGEVWKARDEKLDRNVAVKVLPQSVAADPDTLARFEREAKAVAALSHPNILAIHDFGNQDGIAYAVMELLEGETLREKLDAGPIFQRQALDYALQTVHGLSAAHKKGVVHRDLKPENVFVTKDGHVKILDFGMAKRVDAVSAADLTSAPTVVRHTEPGMVMGTVGYVSPEELRGIPVDHRCDLFSFGVILYELLSGERAFFRRTVTDTIAAILRDEPPGLLESGRNVSPALDRIVRHCLEKDRDNRFQSADDIASALLQAAAPDPTTTASVVPPVAPLDGQRKALVAAAVLTVLAAAAVFLLRRPPEGVGQAAGVKRRLAVLPFENLGAPEDDYFADGIADEIRGKLTALSGLQVMARSSSTPYKKTSKTPRQIAQELNVSYLLTATVRWEKSGGTSRVHVSPELVDVTRPDAPTSRWQQPFDAALTDVFQVQSDIATRAAHALGVVLGAGEEKRLSEKPTQNLAAYDAFLLGEKIWNSTGEDAPSVRRALRFYEQAVALDPGFQQAWARVSWADSILYVNSTPSPALAERARQAAKTAIARGPKGPEGYLAFGHYERLVSKDFNRALQHYRNGRQVAPGNADLLYGKARAEEGIGRWDAAVEDLKQAASLDPRSAVNFTALGYALQRLRRYPEAREAYERGLALAPANLSLIVETAMTFLGEGNLAGARAVLDAVPKDVGPLELVAYVASANDLVWVLDEPQRGLLLRLTPNAFDDDRGIWARSMSQAYALQRDAANARAYAEEARRAFEEQLRATPDNAQRRVFLGLALAYLGRKEEAIREGERGVALAPVAKDGVKGPYYQHELVRIYMLVGEPEKALDRLEPLLKVPYYLSPGWLEIDPNFDPLRKNPRFQKLVARAK